MTVFVVIRLILILLAWVKSRKAKYLDFGLLKALLRFCFFRFKIYPFSC